MWIGTVWFWERNQGDCFFAFGCCQVYHYAGKRKWAIGCGCLFKRDVERPSRFVDVKRVERLCSQCDGHVICWWKRWRDRLATTGILANAFLITYKVIRIRLFIIILEKNDRFNIWTVKLNISYPIEYSSTESSNILQWNLLSYKLLWQQWYYAIFSFQSPWFLFLNRVKKGFIQKHN